MMTVSRSRFRSATDDPPREEEIPPPKRSDKPPPRPLCISTNNASAMLVITKMMEKIRIGTVIMGTRSTDVSLTHGFAKKSKLHQRWDSGGLSEERHLVEPRNGSELI